MHRLLCIAVGAVALAVSCPRGAHPATPSLGSEIFVVRQSTEGSLDEKNDYAGRAIALGDFNNDGYDDLALGVPGEDIQGATDTGRVIVLYGSGSGLTADAPEGFTQHRLDRAVPFTGDHFGDALATGDYNDDGFDDLAVAAPDKDIGGLEDVGMVAVLFGSTSGLLPADSVIITQSDYVAPNNTLSGWNLEDQEGDRFGERLASGDFDKDGNDDLVIGVPKKNADIGADVGMVVLLRGSPAGLKPELSQVFTVGTSDSPMPEMENDQWGSALSVGDWDGDGWDDLAVSAPYADDPTSGQEDVGAVILVYGSNQAFDGAGTEAVRQSLLTAQEGLAGVKQEANDRFGTSLTAGDFNADDYSDLAIGTPLNGASGERQDAGEVVVLYGSPSGVVYGGSTGSPDHQRIFESGVPAGGKATFDKLGFSLASGDLNGDSIDDLVIGVPYEDFAGKENNGIVFVLFGRPGGLDPGKQHWISQRYFDAIEEDDDQFGESLALGDVDGDGQMELAVGVPSESVGPIDNSGAVYVGQIDRRVTKVTARSWLVMDRRNGRILGERNANRRRAMASTTKIMTALTELEHRDSVRF